MANGEWRASHAGATFHEDGRDLVRFLQQAFTLDRFSHPQIVEEFEPVETLVRLLDCDPEFGSLLSWGPSTTRSAIIRADGRSGLHQLVPEDICFDSVWKRSAEPNDGESNRSGTVPKLFRPGHASH